MTTTASIEHESLLIERLRRDMPDVANEVIVTIDGLSRLCALGVLTAEHFDSVVAVLGGDVADEWIARQIASEG